jgi:hypothetical protein
VRDVDAFLEYVDVANENRRAQLFKKWSDRVYTPLQVENLVHYVRVQGGISFDIAHIFDQKCSKPTPVMLTRVKYAQVVPNVLRDFYVLRLPIKSGIFFLNMNEIFSVQRKRSKRR